MAEEADDPRLMMALSYAMRADRDALAYLYCRFADDVCVEVLAMTDDARAAEEFTRSLFADLFVALGDYDPALDGPLRGWLLETARQIASDRRRPA